jgi:hypothetical protein
MPTTTRPSLTIQSTMQDMPSLCLKAVQTLVALMAAKYHFPRRNQWISDAELKDELRQWWRRRKQVGGDDFVSQMSQFVGSESPTRSPCKFAQSSPPPTDRCLQLISAELDQSISSLPPVLQRPTYPSHPLLSHPRPRLGHTVRQHHSRRRGSTGRRAPT